MVMTNAFVTVGTTRFDDLITKVLSNDVLRSLRSKGYSKLVVQAGKGWTPANEIREDVKIDIFTSKPSLQDDYERADLIISHAGSGTILEVLRANKPLIVVPNPKLLNDHQGELARALNTQEYLKATTVEGLAETIRIFDPSQLKPFPPPNRDAFGSLLDDEMGFT